MPKTETVCKLMLFLVLLCLLTGCWDREELEDKSYVIGLGLDASKHKGKINVTMLLANPEVGSIQGGGGSTEKPREVITFEANDFIAAKSTANAIISRSINYELLKIIVVSEGFAKDKNFLATFTDVLKDKEIRLNSYIAVSKEKASKYFLKNRPRMETRPHKYFQFMVDHGIENGFIPESTLFRFFKTLERGTDLFLAMYTTAEKDKKSEYKSEDEYIAGEMDVTGDLDDTQFIGAAVFKNGVMISKLTGEETRVVNILDDTTNIKDILVDLPNPFSDSKRQFSVRILKTENNKIKMILKEKPKIYITVPLKVEIMSNPSMVNFSKEKNQQLIKKAIRGDIKKIFEDLLKKSQTELKGVPYPLSLSARKYFWTVEEYKKYNWVKSYVEAEIHVNPKIEVTDYGKQTKKPRKFGD